MPIVNPTTGITSQFSRALDKFNPPGPLPVPVTRSFLFEIIDGTTKVIKESFTLVVPPNAVSIKEGQRVNITKTFGNVFVDDYGPDNITITIRGYSGTSRAFPTFQPAGASVTPAWMLTAQAIGESMINVLGYDHKSAFYTFRDTIMRYKYNYPTTYGDMILRVYDLYDEQSYDCVLLEFSCDREAARPMYYPYSISLLVYGMPDLIGDQYPAFIGLGGIIDSIFDNINAALAWLDAGFAFVQAIKNSVAIVRNSLDMLGRQLAMYTGELSSVLRSPLDITKQLIEAVGSMSTAVDAAYNNYKITKGAYVNAKEMVQYTWRNTMKLYHEAVSEGSQKAKTSSVPLDNGMSIPTGDALHANTPDTGMGAVPADRVSKTLQAQFTGSISYTIKANDTLQSIATTMLGDVNLWPFIAAFNGITNNYELHQLTTLLLPVKSTAGNQTKDRFLVSEDPARDPYGTDIKIDESGDFVVNESGDVSTVSGTENIRQWIDMVLDTERGSMLRQTAFGLTAVSGMAGDDLAVRYLRSGIRTALKMDPRIERVNSVNISVAGDVVNINVDIEVVGLAEILSATMKLV